MLIEFHECIICIFFCSVFSAHCKYCMLFVHQHPMCFTMCINCTLHQFGLQGGCPSNHHPYYFQIGSASRFKLFSCFVRRLILGSLKNTKISSKISPKNSQPQILQLFWYTCISPVLCSPSHNLPASQTPKPLPRHQAAPAFSLPKGKVNT